jgi:hypothetical protein
VNLRASYAELEVPRFGGQLRTKTFWILVRAGATAAKLLKEFPLSRFGAVAIL